jgi:hypothetical protein
MCFIIRHIWAADGFIVQETCVIGQSTHCSGAGMLNDAMESVKPLYCQNKVLRTIGTFPRRTSVRDMHVAFQIPYVYDYITKLCRQQAEVIQTHENAIVRYIGQGEAPHRKYKRLKLGGGHVYDCSSV